MARCFFPELLFLLELTLSHLLELLLDLEAVLGSGYDASLGDLLAVLVVEDHPHGVFEVFELLGVYVDDLLVLKLPFLDEREQDVGRERLDLEVEVLGDLALLEALVDAPDVFAERGVVVVLDAVVGPTITSYN